MIAHRAELRRAGAGRRAVLFGGELIVSRSRDPEPETCRVLAARGLQGGVIFVHRRGTIATGMDIQAGARLNIEGEETKPARQAGAGGFLTERRPATETEHSKIAR